MAKKESLFVGDRVIIKNLSVDDNAVTPGMLLHKGKTATVSKVCRVIGPERRAEIEERLKDVKDHFYNFDLDFVKRYHFDILKSLPPEGIDEFKRLMEDKPRDALALEIDHLENLIIRLTAPYGYELEDVTAPSGIPYTFIAYMLERVE